MHSLDTVDNSQINVLTQRTMHRICTAATNEEVSFAYRASVSGGETHFLRDGEVYRDTGRNHAALFGSFEEESLRSSPPSTLFR